MINVVLAKWLAFSYIPSNWTCPKKEREKRKEKGLRYLYLLDWFCENHRKFQI